MRYVTKSPEQTLKLGYRLGKKIKSGNVVALIGELGAGKTVFTKGIAKALGVKGYEYVNSPSFVIVKVYRAKKTSLYHFDFYRLKSSSDLATVGYEDYFYSDGVSVVEWADRAMDVLPDKHISVKFKHLGNNKREIAVEKSKCKNKKLQYKIF
ncbi:MAG: tRNA (adenosine(37)-N6)-threonylcarbamoyltransferase complex ATPase subunit type 1 TsaE [Omnitrophica bacterium RBG_13_46_9]|nr:MAG: tRNA (adenosine(37)-N6)-threonylcarbamoyltransferase complex ATPase subunit type 1 TsaE [Omnitrophica bacterium RBG_13_46_9]